MRIPGELSKIAGLYGTQKKNVGSVGKTEAVASRKDVLSISNEAKDFQTVFKALKDIPDIRQSRVSELLGSVEAGSYNVAGRDIAAKVIQNVFDKKA